MSKLKVLMLGNDTSVKGGITSVIAQLLGHDWSSESIELKFIPTYIEACNVKKVYFFVKACTKIKKELVRNRPDIVHIHMSYRGSFFRKYYIHKMCRQYGIPNVIHLHGSEFEKWFNESNMKRQEKIKCLLREASAFVVLGEKWKRVIKEIEPQTRIFVLENTVHIPSCITKWNKPCKVLFLGVLIKRKGVSELLKAIKKLHDHGQANDTRYIIAGDGEEAIHLKKECTEYGLDSIVEFTGWVDGNYKETLLEQCQVLVLPSHNEGLPITILEAISHGFPIVATDVGDVSSAVLDGVNGYLIKVGAVEQLAEALNKITKEEIFGYMSKASRRLAEEKFDEKNYFKTLAELYCSIGREIKNE